MAHTQIFKFSMNYYDDIEAEIIKEYGIVSGVNMADAVKNLSEYYGENDIESILIEGCENTLSGIVNCDADVFEKLL